MHHMVDGWGGGSEGRREAQYMFRGKRLELRPSAKLLLIYCYSTWFMMRPVVLQEFSVPTTRYIKQNSDRALSKIISTTVLPT